jgi:hypothetical protein
MEPTPYFDADGFMANSREGFPKGPFLKYFAVAAKVI